MNLDNVSHYVEQLTFFFFKEKCTSTYMLYSAEI